MGTNDQKPDDEDAEVIELTQPKARMFLEALAEDPFIAVVVADDGVVSVFSKNIEPEHLDRIKHVLSDLTKGE